MKSFITELKREKAFVFSINTAKKLMEDINTPVSLSIYMLIQHGEWNQIVNKEIDALSYQSAWDFALDYQAVSFLRKADFLPTGIDTKQVALEKFLESEELCRDTNQSLRDRLRDKVLTTESLSTVLFRASNKIAAWIRDVPDMSSLQYALGPGATGSCRGSDVSVANKLGSKAVVYPGSDPYFRQSIRTLPHVVAGASQVDSVAGPFSAVQKVTYQLHNELFFVPKNAKTDRAICVEPHSMPPLQRGVGLYLSRCLKSAGIDISKQDRINAALAKEGSLSGGYATIDLSAASDTISISLVSELLSNEWFNLLSSLRAPFTKLPDGSFIENEKFSSMGNGFTFELETMIFYALALSVKDSLGCSGQISVFGDDIIVPTDMAQDLINVLTACGLKTNADKTFISGPFRESCGSDYFNGHNVRPYFYKELILYESDKFKIANGIRHCAHRLYNNGDCYSGLRRSWSYVIKSLPKELHCFGPRDLGDQVIWADRASSAGCYSMHFGTTRIPRTVQSKPRLKNLGSFSGPVILATALYGSPSRIPIRGTGRPYLRYKPITVHHWDWLDGSWS